MMKIRQEQPYKLLSLRRDRKYNYYNGKKKSFKYNRKRDIHEPVSYFILMEVLHVNKDYYGTRKITHQSKYCLQQYVPTLLFLGMAG